MTSREGPLAALAASFTAGEHRRHQPGEQQHAEFREDGVVHLAGALDERAMHLAEDAFQWTLEHPGPGAREVLGSKPGAFFQDHANPQAFPAYRPLLCETGLSEIVADLLGSGSLWLLYEQIWLKQGGATRRTPWHQDLGYIPLDGEHLAVVWLSLDAVAHENSLEFVRGSHRGPLFNPTAFDANDPALSMFEPGPWPSLPDIESEREKWPIVAWAVKPGDVIVFHPAILHGGAPTLPGARRRTISLRFFGDHAFCAARPETGLAQSDRLRRDDGGRDPIEQMALLPPGTVFRHPGFPKLR
jgi:ectoine hydroxylase-related dioxygenase (phytanoyl-CoA dioxygenase family)